VTAEKEPAKPVQDRLRIVSHFPGRLRVRASTFRVLPEVGEEVAERVAQERGVSSAELSPVTGSLLVTYEPRELQLPRLIALIIRIGGLHGLELDVDNAWMNEPDGGEKIRDALGKWNDTLKELSQGKIDLKTTVPAGLTAIGLLRLIGGAARWPEWYDFVFYGFVTFMNVNPRRGDAVARGTDRDGGGDEDDGKHAAR
jgi:hypothetical protein